MTHANTSVRWHVVGDGHWNSKAVTIHDKDMRWMRIHDDLDKDSNYRMITTCANTSMRWHVVGHNHWHSNTVMMSSHDIALIMKGCIK